MMRLFVLTSDKYLHCLPPFVEFFNRFWKVAQEVIFVGFERPNFRLPNNVRFWSLGAQADFTWSEAALKLCRMIPDPVFALFLEDYFLDRPVNTYAVYTLYEAMLKNPQIVKVDLTDDRLKVPHTDHPSINGIPMVRSADDALFQTSLQAALWRKDFFYQCLAKSENPWAFEKRGGKRVIGWHENELFHILGCKNPPVHYINAVGGEGGHPHIWATKRMPYWMVSELRAKGWMTPDGQAGDTSSKAG